MFWFFGGDKEIFALQGDYVGASDCYRNQELESGAKFAAHIEKAANELVGRFNLAEHKAYKGLRYGQFNHVF
jgi:hypothetical protein